MTISTDGCEAQGRSPSDLRSRVHERVLRSEFRCDEHAVGVGESKPCQAQRPLWTLPCVRVGCSRSGVGDFRAVGHRGRARPARLHSRDRTHRRCPAAQVAADELVAANALQGAVATARAAAATGGTAVAAGASQVCSTDPESAEAGEHIALGLERVVEEQAASVGATHLMQDPNWKQTFLSALGNQSSKFTLFLDNLAGDSAYQKIIAAVTRSATGVGGATDWEIAQLYQSGRLGGVNLVEGGAAVPNPFQ
jgi:hypothetical protein